MFDIHRVELDWGGRKLVLETGKIARQADGAVLATYGDTTVLATVVAAKQPREGVDFLPLTVDYQEKYYAAGAFPAAISSARAVRPKRKRWFPAYRPPDPSAVRGRLAQRDPGHRHHAIARPGERSRHPGTGRRFGGADPFGRTVHGPIGAARVGFTNDEYVLNPSSTRWLRAISTSSSPAPPTPC